MQKLDSLIDAKTKALSDLDEANKVKNKAYGIDVNKSATSRFISELVNAKIQSATGSIGPVVNTAQNFFSNTKSGLTNAFVSKLAPLSSIATGLSSPPSTGKIEKRSKFKARIFILTDSRFFFFFLIEFRGQQGESRYQSDERAQLSGKHFERPVNNIVELEGSF